MLLLTADRVVVGSAGAVHTPGAVVVEGPGIRWAGSVRALPADLAAQADRVELGALTLLPGLIDAHVHLAMDGSEAPADRMAAQNDAQGMALMLRGARELLAAGITTARDLGAKNFLDIEVKRAIRDGLAEGPRLLTAARPITVPGGHCWFMGGEVSSIDEIRRMVRQHHEAGADLIKIMATGGFMTPGSTPWDAPFSTREIKAAVEEAHRLGMKVAAHAHGRAGIARAAAAGVDTIEHCSFAGEGSMPGGRHTLDYDERAVDAIAAAGIFVCPTTNVTNLRLSEESWLLRAERITRLRKAGVQIVAGTDAGIDNTPHGAYVHGLDVLAATGMSNAEVIEAATLRAARALGVDALTGSLESGKAADVIAVDGNPLDDIGALHNVRMVLADGRPVVPPPSGHPGDHGTR